MYLKNAIAQFLLAISTFTVHAQNPIIKNMGVSDPHIRVFNDTLFLYSGHDANPKAKTWVMKDWRVFSSTDLINWKHRTTISPESNYMDNNSTDCWASDAAVKNGKYYFYFSDRKRGVGVMKAPQPTGPFADALGKPLVSPMHDPTVFIEKDSLKTAYLIYGDKAGGGFHITQLNADMISVAETPKPITITGKAWKAAPQWMDKNYLFKHNDTYYLSWGRDYATSKHIYGPYRSVGAVGEGYGLSEFAHGSFFNWKGQFYHIWCYYITKGFKYRESIISYCHIDNTGQIVTDTKFLDAHFNVGVGQYNANWDTIEAEWYYEKQGNINKRGTAKTGFYLSNIAPQDWIKFAKVTIDAPYTSILAHLAYTGTKGTVEFRVGAINGKCLGKLKLGRSLVREGFKTHSCNINTTKGVTDLYLVFKGTKDSTFKLDWIKFN